MKITLGGKLSIGLALVFAGFSATVVLVPMDAGNIQQFCGVVLYYLSFPIGRLNGMFDGGHSGSQSQLVVYGLLMFINCFLLGYSIAGVLHLFRLGCRKFRSKS